MRHDNALRAASAAAVARGAQARRSRPRVPSFPASPGTEHSPEWCAPLRCVLCAEGACNKDTASKCLARVGPEREGAQEVKACSAGGQEVYLRTSTI